MAVGEVVPGMKGYGLSVFKGTKIERFEVEVISVAKNFNPGFDGVLIMCKGQNLEHTGSIAGMSGSPVYLYDSTGKARMLGAFAFGWNLAKDPIAGVQPIEYMLKYADPKTYQESTEQGTAAIGKTKKPSGKILWKLADGQEAARRLLEGSGGTFADRSSGLSWTVSGFSPAAFEAVRPMAEKMGLRLMFAPGASGNVAGSAESVSEAELLAAAKIEPGSSLVIPVVTGDMEMAAVGTCTEVIGDRVFGFGHPFNGDGGVELPMAAGYVNTVVATLTSSFKVGAAGPKLGVMRADTAVGIAGTFGGEVKMIPMSVRVQYTDGSLDRTYHMQSVKHPTFTPQMALLTTMGAATGVRNLPREHTLDYSMTLKFSGDRKIVIADRLANATQVEMMFALILPIMTVMNNPFERIYPESIETTLKVDPVAKASTIVAASSSRTRVKRGEKIPLTITERAYLGSETKRQLDLELPHDIEPGEYTVTISDKSQFETDEATARPDLYSAETVDQLFAAVNANTRFKSDAIYIRLTRPARGLAVGRTALQKMPGSKRTLLQGAGTSSGKTIAEVSESVTKIMPVDYVVSGTSQIQIVVEDNESGPQRATATKSP